MGKNGQITLFGEIFNNLPLFCNLTSWTFIPILHPKISTRAFIPISHGKLDLKNVL